ncbi:MAG: hypothetical protein AAFO82_00775 [Bacteroidota bacterium]
MAHNVTIELENDLAQKVNKLVQFFGSKELLFTNLIEFHQKRIRREIAQIQKDLNQYEQQYEMSSAVFFEQFENGQLEDSQDFILWSGIYEMQLNSKNKLEELA